MPELPEVETTRRSLETAMVGRRIHQVIVRDRRLRWPIPADLEQRLVGRKVVALARRAKYLLIDLGDDALLIHLGMSGSLRLLPAHLPADRHDHLDLRLDDNLAVRLRDPRRFGAVLLAKHPPMAHPLLAHLGPEPLGNQFGGQHLYNRSRGRRTAVKNFIMDARVVVGVGNIYASEALFMAGIHPARAAGRVSLARYTRLAECIRNTLSAAIEAGGTTLRDYVQGSGEEGAFGAALKVYGRTGQPCAACGSALRQRVIGQRSSFFCVRCQH